MLILKQTKRNVCSRINGNFYQRSISDVRASSLRIVFDKYLLSLFEIMPPIEILFPNCQNKPGTNLNGALVFKRIIKPLADLKVYGLTSTRSMSSIVHIRLSSRLNSPF